MDLRIMAMKRYSTFYKASRTVSWPAPNSAVSVLLVTNNSRWGEPFWPSQPHNYHYLGKHCNLFVLQHIKSMPDQFLEYMEPWLQEKKPLSLLTWTYKYFRKWYPGPMTILVPKTFKKSNLFYHLLKFVNLTNLFSNLLIQLYTY